MSNDGDELLNTAQVAGLYGVSATWINDLARAGLLVVAYKAPYRNGARMYRRADLPTELPTLAAA